MKQARWLAIGALSLFVLLRGVLPAMEGIDTDFPNYYTSAKLLISGGDMSRVYDDAWFQDQIHLNGMNQLGKFAPFPPVTALVMVPVVFLSPQNALRVWTIFNLVLLAYTIVLVSKIMENSWSWGALVVLLSGHALANNFRFGQFYLVLTLLILLGYRFWLQGRTGVSGALFGIGACFKYFPAIFLLQFAARREWKTIASFAATVALVTTISIALLGPAVHLEFLRRVLGPHLQGNIQDPFSPMFQSWNSLLKRMFTYDSVQNPNPLVNGSLGYVVGLTIVYAIVAVALLSGIRNARSNPGAYASSIQFALIGIAGLLLLPASATYHFLLLLPSVAILLKGKRWTFSQKALLVFYSCIGFLPYRYFEQFSSRGVLMILAYPRLILMSALFVAALSIVHEGPKDHRLIAVEPSGA